MLNYDAEKSSFWRKNLEEGQKLKMNLSRFFPFKRPKCKKRKKGEREQ